MLIFHLRVDNSALSKSTQQSQFFATGISGRKDLEVDE
jgi:hypothetical protein